MSNPIAKADVLGFAPEFASMDAGEPNQLDASLAYFNSAADVLISPAVFPDKAPVPTSGQDAVQKIATSSAPNHGSAVLSLDGQASAPINFDDPASSIQFKLEGIPGVGSGNVSVIGSVFPDFTATFQGTLGQMPVDALELVTNGLGVVPATRLTVQVLDFSVPDGSHDFSYGGMKVQVGDQVTAFLDSQAFGMTPPHIQGALEALSNVGVGNVLVLGDFGDPVRVKFYVVFLNALQNAPMPAVAVVGNTLADIAGDLCPAITYDATGSLQKVVFSSLSPNLLGAFQLALDGEPGLPVQAADVSNGDVIRAAVEASSAIGVGNVLVLVDGPFIFGQSVYFLFKEALGAAHVDALEILANSLRTDNGPVTMSQVTVVDPPGVAVPVDLTIEVLAPGLAPLTPYRLARMLVVCHFLKMTQNTEGRIASDKVGDLATSYAVPDVNGLQDWNNSIYGQRYVQLRRIYAMGVSVAPRPLPIPPQV